MNQNRIIKPAIEAPKPPRLVRLRPVPATGSLFWLCAVVPASVKNPSQGILERLETIVVME